MLLGVLLALFIPITCIHFPSFVRRGEGEVETEEVVQDDT